MLVNVNDVVGFNNLSMSLVEDCSFIDRGVLLYGPKVDLGNALNEVEVALIVVKVVEYGFKDVVVGFVVEVVVFGVEVVVVNFVAEVVIVVFCMDNVVGGFMVETVAFIFEAAVVSFVVAVVEVEFVVI